MKSNIFTFFYIATSEKKFNPLCPNYEIKNIYFFPLSDQSTLPWKPFIFPLGFQQKKETIAIALGTAFTKALI